jgi:hypothetical protein
MSQTDEPSAALVVVLATFLLVGLREWLFLFVNVTSHIGNVTHGFIRFSEKHELFR